MKAIAKKVFLALLGVGLLVALFFAIARGGPLAPTKLTVAKVERGVVTPFLFGVGTVEARRAYLIGPTVASRVLRVLVDVGDTVQAGQLLAEMDPVDLDQRVASLDASLARARSAMAAAEAQQRDAEGRRELAAANLRRYRDLVEKQFVSQGAMDAKVQEEKSAQAGVDTATAGLSAARQDLARVQEDRAGLLRQRASLRLLAPVAGLVTSREAEPGSTVVAGQAVLRLVEPSSLWARVRFDQGRSQGLAVDLPARLVRRADPGNELTAKVARIEPVSDAVTEERIAQVAFAEPPAGLSVGEIVEATVGLPDSGETLVLPNASVRRMGPLKGVWLVEGNTLRFTPVKTGLTSLDGLVQISSGVKAGDNVVVYSERDLTPGARFQVVDSLPGQH
jgi:HlyD family secretion protein